MTLTQFVEATKKKPEKKKKKRKKDEAEGYGRISEDFVDPNGQQYLTTIQRRLPLVRWMPYHY